MSELCELTELDSNSCAHCTGSSRLARIAGEADHEFTLEFVDRNGYREPSHEKSDYVKTLVDWDRETDESPQPEVQVGEIDPSTIYGQQQAIRLQKERKYYGTA